jgi:hypothetical protein
MRALTAASEAHMTWSRQRATAPDAVTLTLPFDPDSNKAPVFLPVMV